VAYNFRVAVCRSLLLAHVLVPAMLQGQEVHYIDLTGVQQRTELRYPPAPPSDCKAGVPCVISAWGGGSIACGAPDLMDPRALTVQIPFVVPDRIDPVQPMEVEFRILNSGRVPLEVPASPHLSDLQPPDESGSFSYMSLALAVNVINCDAHAANPDCSKLRRVIWISGGCQDDAGPELRRMDPRPSQPQAIAGVARDRPGMAQGDLLAAHQHVSSPRRRWSHGERQPLPQ
jgi:hypothetical protein